MIDMVHDSRVMGSETLWFSGGVIRRAGVDSVMKQSHAVIVPRKSPPNISSAQMSGNGLSIAVSFTWASSGTLFGSAGSVNCSSVFRNNNLGTGALCSWTSATVLQVLLGASRGVPLIDPSTSSVVSNPCPASIPSTTLVLRSGVIVAVTGSLASSTEQCVSVKGPENPVAPIVSLSGPQSIGNCDGLRLDASGTVDSAGRGLVFHWSVNPMNEAATLGSIVTLLSSSVSVFPNQTFPVLVMESSDLEPSGVFQFTVTVTNYFGASANGSVVVRVASAPLPLVSIDGPTSRQVTPADRLSLAATGAVPICKDSASADKKLDYEWSLVSANVIPGVVDVGYSVTNLSPWLPSLQSFVGRQRSVLNLPMLQLGITYRIQVTTFLVSNRTLANTASVDVSVGSGGVRAVISGGSSRSVGSQTSWTISANSSVDLDGIALTTFSFSWSCSALGSDGTSATVCNNTIGEALDLSPSGPHWSSNGSMLSFESGVLSAGLYTFTVVVSKGAPGGLIPNHFRSSTAAVSVTVVAGSPPTIYMDAMPSKVNPTDKVTLSARVDGHGSLVTLLWRSPDMSSSDFGSILRSSSLTQSQLVLQPNLPPGTYAFVLSGRNTDNQESSAVASLIVNGPPYRGYLFVTPTTGIALQDSYTLAAVGWVDEVSHASGFPLLPCDPNDIGV
jgi:REJ domain